MPTQADVYSQRARGLKLRQPLFYLLHDGFSHRIGFDGIENCLITFTLELALLLFCSKDRNRVANSPQSP